MPNISVLDEYLFRIIYILQASFWKVVQTLRGAEWSDTAPSCVNYIAANKLYSAYMSVWLPYAHECTLLTTGEEYLMF